MKYTFGVITTVHAYVKYSASKTYNYWLTYGNATHRLEFFYVVYGDKVKDDTSSDAALARSVGQLWTNFAKTGVPTASGEITW
ncbi:hypothetical protein PR048_018170 [Dryococelus australis]|uniref:Carboxylesterase type B domain-containing protein n=1 Tax=Dryococelus australis TaxID=614101 RepID=A0ABQ9HBN0_9NEOP|nr:hypothetical protein PR048_018170 [Dryococelus australis]